MMKSRKNIFRRTMAFAILLLLVIPSSEARGRIIKRLKFAYGTSSTVVKGTLRSQDEIVYLVGAKKGQRMSVKLIGKSANNDVVLTIQGPDGEEISDVDTSWKGKLPKTGDYSISIGLIESKSGSYTLEVMITD